VVQSHRRRFHLRPKLGGGRSRIFWDHDLKLKPGRAIGEVEACHC
jgi:hypothetical protein